MSAFLADNEGRLVTFSLQRWGVRLCPRAPFPGNTADASSEEEGDRVEDGKGKRKNEKGGSKRKKSYTSKKSSKQSRKSPGDEDDKDCKEEENKSSSEGGDAGNDTRNTTADLQKAGEGT